nr:hypothetical protein [Tanacetum cinerariifolium]
MGLLLSKGNKIGCVWKKEHGEMLWVQKNMGLRCKRGEFLFLLTLGKLWWKGVIRGSLVGLWDKIKWFVEVPRGQGSWPPTTAKARSCPSQAKERGFESGPRLGHSVLPSLPVLKEFRPKIQFELPSGMVLVKRCGYLLRNTYLNSKNMLGYPRFVTAG